MAPYAESILNGDPSTYGFLLASFSLGAIGGALVTGRVNVRDHVGSILFGGLIASGALVVLLGFVSLLWLALAVSIGIGFFEAALNLPIQVLVQTKIPGSILGRTIGTLGSLVSLTVPLASFASGTLASGPPFLTIPMTFEVFGGLLVVVVVEVLLDALLLPEWLPEVEPHPTKPMPKATMAIATPLIDAVRVNALAPVDQAARYFRRSIARFE